MADELLEILKAIDPAIELKYNKFYVGLARQGQPCNFIILRPKKDWLRIEPRLPIKDEIQKELEEAGLEVLGYDSRERRYRILFKRGDIAKNKVMLSSLFRQSYEEND